MSRRRMIGALALATGALVSACAADDAEFAVDAGPQPSPLRTPVMPATPYVYDVALPAHVTASLGPGVDNTPADNPINDAGAALGRVLFHDRLLSVDQSTSCASCHRLDVGVADDVAASLGVAGETSRASMPAVELRFYARGRMFWDERAATVEEQVLQPIQNEVEMGLTLPEAVARVSAAAYYPALFDAAFGSPDVTADGIARALAQYVRSINGWSSRWDAEVAATGDLAAAFPGFTAEENRGKQIFFGQHDPATRGLCGTCHMRDNPLATLPPGAPPHAQPNIALFQSIGPADNGLPPRDGDGGVGDVTGRPQDVNVFKVGTLRNIALTGPYMHDGRFATLAEVVDFYDHGITATPNLHPALRDAGGQPLRLGLSVADRAALVAFLATLTDQALATDPRFADPFVDE